MSDKEQKWIGVDLDGTLATYDSWKGNAHCGKPIPLMVARVRRWLSEGKQVKIFTARADSAVARKAIREWLSEVFGEDGAKIGITNVKDRHMTKLYDDRAVGVEKNTGIQKSASIHRFLCQKVAEEAEKSGVPRLTLGERLQKVALNCNNGVTGALAQKAQMNQTNKAMTTGAIPRPAVRNGGTKADWLRNNLQTKFSRFFTGGI